MMDKYGKFGSNIDFSLRFAIYFVKGKDIRHIAQDDIERDVIGK